MSEKIPSNLKQSDLIDPITNHVNEIQKLDLIKLPPNYVPANALNAAYYLIKEVVKDKNYKPAIEVCSKESIFHCLKNMVVKGLNPAKKQCYFIVVNGELVLLDSYYGDLAMAMTFGNLTHEPACNLVYSEDVFEMEIDIKTGFESITKHSRGKSRDPKNIIGAYAMAKNHNGREWFEYMDIEQIKRAWALGNKLTGKKTSSLQENFSDRAAKRTVVRRLCSDIYNTSSDYSILADQKDETNVIVQDIEETLIELPEPKKEIENKTPAPVSEKEQPKKGKEVISEMDVSGDFD